MKLFSEVQDFVSMAVCGLCDSPSMVKTEVSTVNENTFFILVVCEKDDVKRVIGANGRNIDAVRVLAKAISRKNKINTSIGVDG